MRKLNIPVLKNIAIQATGGPWTIEKQNQDSYILFSGRSDYLHGLNLLYISEPDWNWEHNKDFIEKFDPDTVLQLLQYIELLEMKLKDQE